MAQEHETQVLDVNPKSIITKLRLLKAKEYPEIMQRRWVFNIDIAHDKNVNTGAWIRLRQAGNETTLTYKNKKGPGMSETEEIEVRVDDFDATAKMFHKMNGFTGIYYQENKRKKFVYKNIEFTLDTWPRIPVYLEIEARNEKDIHTGLRLLSLEKKDEGHIGTQAIYRKYGIELHAIKELRFK